MKKYFCLILILFARQLTAQNVGIGTNTPNSSAMLEINSSSKGLLLPRVADTSSVNNPAKGLIVYSTNTNKLWFYDGGRWQQTVANAGGMDSIWYKSKDTVVYTTKSYVGINSDFSLMPPQANLQVNGGLLIQGRLDYSNSAPTAAQTYTMNNSSYQAVPGSDSVFRIYDPGGAGNYGNSQQGNVSITPGDSQEGYMVESAVADFGFGTGDTLWISTTSFPACRTNYLYRYSGVSINPEKFIVPVDFNFIFRSNADGNNGKGFNFLVTRLYDRQPTKKINTAGPALAFNVTDGSFSAGTGSQAGLAGTAMGYHSRAGITAIAAGVNAEASGNGSVALGDGPIADGNKAVALRGYAHGDNSFAFGSTANGERSLAFGQYSQANGTGAMVLGLESRANGDNSLAAGHFAYAVGEVSVSLGSSTNALGFASAALNRSTDALGSYSLAAGLGTQSAGYAGTAIGMYNNALSLNPQTTVAPLSALFIVGNGDNSSARKNALTVLKNGDVGIGVPTFPEDRLHVVGGNILFDNTSNTTIQLQANGVEKGFFQLSGNNIRVGGYSSNSTANFIVRLNGADRFTVSPSGNATLDGTLTQSSDARFKTDINLLDHSLDKILQLNGYQYHWKPELNKDSGLQIGLIAQNVESVLPELVVTNAEGMKSVAYQNLIPILIEAIKELKKRMEK